MILFKRAFTAAIFAAILAASVIGPASGAGKAAPSAPAASPEKGKAAGAVKAPAPEQARIEWMDWGPEAFRKAILRERPILLNIVVSWSRSCREAEALWNDPAIARIVSDSFVAVRVDADRRPDLRERYPAPGWPAITLLLPNGVPFYAAREGGGAPVRLALSNFSPERLKGVLEEAAASLRDPARRAALKRTVEEGQKADAEPKLEKGRIDPSTPRKVFDALRGNFDAIHGGWTKAPKYFMPGPTELCLFQYAHDRDPKGRELAGQALDAVTNGPLFDRVDGGAFRIAAKEDWSAPQYEKLLDRNVALLDSLLDAYLLTSKQDYADRAGEILRFLDGTLRRPGGGYAASQAADPASPDGGAWYRATAGERRKLPPPPVSGLVPVAGSAKAAAAELRAAILMQREDWLTSARGTLAWVMKTGYERGRGVYHAMDGAEAILPAFLEDQVLFAEAMIDAYQLTGDKAYLAAARDVAGFAIENLFDRKLGLFGDIIPNPADPAKPMREPLHPYEGNCRMARVLARLYYLSPQEKSLRQSAESVLEMYASTSDRGPSAALYALAVSEYSEGPVWAWVVGNPQIPGFQAMLSAAHRAPVLWKLVVSLDPADGKDAQTIAQLGFTKRQPPVVYFTSGTHTSQPAALAREVPTVWQSLAQVLAAEKEEAAKAPPAPAGPGSRAGPGRGPLSGRTLSIGAAVTAPDQSGAGVAAPRHPGAGHPSPAEETACRQASA